VPENNLFQALNRPIIFRSRFLKFTEIILSFENYLKALDFSDSEIVSLLRWFLQGPALQWLDSFKKTLDCRISPTKRYSKSKISEHFKYLKTEVRLVIEFVAVRMNSSLQDYVTCFWNGKKRSECDRTDRNPMVLKESK
jgi:hypothetical protein